MEVMRIMEEKETRRITIYILIFILFTILIYSYGNGVCIHHFIRYNYNKLFIDALLLYTITILLVLKKNRGETNTIPKSILSIYYIIIILTIETWVLYIIGAYIPCIVYMYIKALTGSLVIDIYLQF